jgi:hypothetical protein
MRAIAETKRKTLWTVPAASGKLSVQTTAADASPPMPTRKSHSVLRNVVRSCGRACRSATVSPRASSVSHGAAELQNANGLGAPFKTASSPK